MSGRQVRKARLARAWTQGDLAEKLGVSQAYISFLESSQRPVLRRLASRLVWTLGLPPTALPVLAKGEASASAVAASALGTLGHTGFSHLASKRTLNPAELLARTLLFDSVEARIVEALPWLVARYANIDWNWLVTYAEQYDLQNRLGFVVTLARELAQRRGDDQTTQLLKKWEGVLEGSRLLKEDSFAGNALTQSERRWLRANRSAEAARWNMLSNVTVEALTNV